MEPETTSKLKASFGEYEELGKRHKQVSDRIAALQEAMKFSRQSGAFQALQNQMREVKDLVKQKEDLDGKMAVADLARKKDDDHRLAVKQEVSYSEKLGTVGDRIAELESLLFSYAEQSGREFDFARCQRADGSFYGTRGKCKKGTQVDKLNEEAKQHAARGEFLKGARKALKAHGIREASSQAAPRKESLADTKERMAGNREAYLAQKKSAMKRGPLHKEVAEARDRVKEQLPDLTARKKELDRLVRAARAQEQVVKKDRSKENRDRLKLVLAAVREQERAVRRSEKEVERLARQYRALDKKNERAKMSPQQRAAEAALDREMRLRG